MKAWSRTFGLFAIVVSLVNCGGEGQAPSFSDDVDLSSRESAVVVNKSLKIGIIGAGASGLTAAQTLKQNGFANVTIFEKEAKAGGKVLSFYGANPPAELGAVWASPDYTVTLQLANEFGVPTAPYSTPMVLIGEDGKSYSFDQFLLSKYTPQQIGASIQAYLALSAKYKINSRSGFYNLPAELRMNFSDFSAKYGIMPIADLLKAFLVGCGYGYYETVPTMYYLKLVDWMIKISPTGQLSLPQLSVFPTGFQDLWVKVASAHDVRLSTEVTRVERAKTGPSKIKVVANGQEHFFDKLVVSIPPNAVSKLLDLSDKERTQFNKVMHSNRYFVSLAKAANLVGGRSVLPFENTRPDRIGHVNIWGNRDPNMPVYVAYQIADWNHTPEQVTGFLAEDMMKYGNGTLLGLLVRKEWDYFPTVDTATLNSGFYEVLEAMQGTFGTYYVGSLMNLETVEHTARYAKDLMQKHFPK